MIRLIIAAALALSACGTDSGSPNPAPEPTHGTAGDAEDEEHMVTPAIETTVAPMPTEAPFTTTAEPTPKPTVNVATPVEPKQTEWRTEFYRCEKTATYDNGEIGFLNDFQVTYQDNVFNELWYTAYYFSSGNIEGVPLDGSLQFNATNDIYRKPTDTTIKTALGLKYEWSATNSFAYAIPAKAVNAKLDFDIEKHTLTTEYTVVDITGAHVVLSTYNDEVQCSLIK